MAKFTLVLAQFQLNLDEDRATCNEENVKVVASFFGEKEQKNLDDFRGCTTIVRIKIASGGEGPVMFL